jgi:mono/diheme cytochrome c family protein
VRRIAWLAALTGALALVGAAGLAFHRYSQAGDFADAEDQTLVARGRLVYAERCASCHGDKLQGQPHWQRLNDQGRLPAPPQDQTGHSWMHSDAELFQLVRKSVADVAPPGYQSDMPAFGDTLPDPDIAAVIAFIKSSWPMGVRVYQALQNPDGAGMPANAVGGDWRLPPDCGAEPARQ